MRFFKNWNPDEKRRVRIFPHLTSLSIKTVHKNASQSQYCPKIANSYVILTQKVVKAPCLKGVKRIKKRKNSRFWLFFRDFGDPYGTRTHDTTVKGWCLNRLTKGPVIMCFW